MRHCTACGEELAEKFKFCGSCGARVAEPEAAPEAQEELRKTVTVVFSDLKGSTSLGERVDSESLRELLGTYFAAMKTVLERHGGFVEKYIGDAVMAIFGVPTMHEDDALRAVRAAFEMRAALTEVNVELSRRFGVALENRTGVNTGEVIASAVARADRIVTGDTVNVAARLEQAAPANEVLIGETTYRLVRDAVEVEEMEPLELKGKSERVPAWRLLAVGEGEAITRRMDLPMVGRGEELARLSDAMKSSAGKRRCELVTILGTAGMGKSRLIEELVASAGQSVRVLKGRCLPYGGSTFQPFAEVIHQAARVHPSDTEAEVREKLASAIGDGGEEVVERLASVMGLSAATYPKEELFWAARVALDKIALEGG
ncbi:MAG: adenylate/guanylate cyclase domain-containing protein, partial [Acidimicrobiales bacterium]